MAVLSQSNYTVWLQLIFACQVALAEGHTHSIPYHRRAKSSKK